MESQKAGLPIKAFKTSKSFEQWLKKNHISATGLWLKFYKKQSGVATVTYEEAVEVALCYGWIDGLANGYDENSYLQRFTPRRARSIWSKLNVERAKKLIETGRMKPAGIKHIEAAKSDGRWQAAYDSPANTELPKDFLTLLSKKPKAKKFFDTLNKTNRFAINWRLQTAKKPETRARRMMAIIEMLASGKKFH